MTDSASKTILYIEDQPEKVQPIILMLTKKCGNHVDLAETLSDAQVFLDQKAYDLIVLDIRFFPSASEGVEAGDGKQWQRRGLYFLEDLRAGKIAGKTPHDVPVLVVSAVVETQDVDEIRRIGGSNGARCAYLAKPVSLDRVELAVAELLRGSRS